MYGLIINRLFSCYKEVDSSRAFIPSVFVKIINDYSLANFVHEIIIMPAKRLLKFSYATQISYR